MSKKDWSPLCAEDFGSSWPRSTMKTRRSRRSQSVPLPGISTGSGRSSRALPGPTGPERLRLLPTSTLSRRHERPSGCSRSQKSNQLTTVRFRTSTDTVNCRTPKASSMPGTLRRLAAMAPSTMSTAPPERNSFSARAALTVSRNPSIKRSPLSWASTRAGVVAGAIAAEGDQRFATRDHQLTTRRRTWCGSRSFSGSSSPGSRSVAATASGVVGSRIVDMLAPNSSCCRLA